MPEGLIGRVLRRGGGAESEPPLERWAAVEALAGEIAQRHVLDVGAGAGELAARFEAADAGLVLACDPQGSGAVRPFAWQALDPHRHGLFHIVCCERRLSREPDPVGMLLRLRECAFEGGRLVLETALEDHSGMRFSVGGWWSLGADTLADLLAATGWTAEATRDLAGGGVMVAAATAPISEALLAARHQTTEANNRFPVGHYYSPLPDHTELQEEPRRSQVWPATPRETPGIDWRDADQLRLLREVFAAQTPLRFVSEAEARPDQYFFDNSQYPPLDAWLLSSLLTYLRPRRMIEIGSGFSSLVTAEVNRDRLGGELHFTCIEPYPRQFLLDGVPGISDLRVEKIQDTPLEVFEALGDGDVLFVDTAHVVKTGGDVTWIYERDPSAARAGRARPHPRHLPARRLSAGLGAGGLGLERDLPRARVPRLQRRVRGRGRVAVPDAPPPGRARRDLPRAAEVHRTQRRCAMAAPAVGVVIVAHGAWTWTERALDALAAYTPVEHEVVLVDNASPDATLAELRARYPSVRVVENDTNVGFGPACNQGAQACTAPLVCFLNTDALVEPGWLEPLVAAIGPGVGAAVPCVLEIDGETVQCAGALLGRDGSVLEYGNGWSPDAAELRFPRAVDFGPAACLLVDRAAFLAAGGFDDRYAPAYYEDADLCLALAARGLRTLFVPASRVRHARHGSGDRSAAIALSERNRAAFVARWSETLSGRPSTLHPPAAALSVCARDAGCDGRVLALAADAETLLALRAARPWTRVTLVAGDDGWSGYGIEVLPEVPYDRPFHYDLVLADGPAPGFVGAHVAAPPLGDLEATLAAAGLAPL